MTDESGVYLSFPPTGIGISRDEYRSLTMDLPHLCLNDQPTFQAVTGNEMKNTIEKFRRTLKFHKKKINDSDCIFMVVNIPKQHWCLVCLCNLRTIQTNFIDFEDLHNN